MMVETPEKKEKERQQNAKRKHHNAPLMNHPTVLEDAEAKKVKPKISKRRDFFGEYQVKPRTPRIKTTRNHSSSWGKRTILGEFQVKSRTPRIEMAESCTKLAKTGVGNGENHSASLEKHTILSEVRVKTRTPQSKIAESCTKLAKRGFGHGRNHSALVKKNTILDGNDDKEEVLEKMRSKRRNLDGESRTPRIEMAESSTKLAKTGCGNGESHSASLKKSTILDDDDEEEELEKMRSKRRNLDGESRTPHTQIAGKSNPVSEKLRKPNFDEENHSASVKKNIILDDDDDNEEQELETHIAEKLYPPKLKSYFDWKNRNASVKKSTILDGDNDKEEELEKMESKRRNLDGESRTPQTQIAGKSKIGYSIDGKKLPKPEFGYSIDGKKLPRYPPIKEILSIIGECSKPFEKKLLKSDVDRISFNRNDVKNGIIPVLTEGETADLLEGILVNTYDEFGKCYEMKFESYCNCFYKLCNGWEELYKDHKLNENEDCYVAVWTFRNAHTDGVCFAVILKR